MRAKEFIFNEGQHVDEGWKELAATGILGLGLANPNNIQPSTPTTSTATATTVSQNQANQVANSKSTKHAAALLHNPNAKVLNKAAKAAGLKGKELAQFLAQCAHETQNFKSLKEIGKKPDFKKYDVKHNPRLAKILGNTHAGDGYKYIGRGYIQLTGRDNYKRAGDALNLPLEKYPHLAEKPEVAAKVAVWFWKNRVVPRVASFDNTAQVTKPINSGMAGLEDRHNKYIGFNNLIKSKAI